MKACEGKIGRVFVIRLEDGDKIPQCIESFAKQHGISTGQVILVGGVASGQIVSGPRYSDRMPPEPMLLPVDSVHEVLGVGVLAPEKDGNPVLHIHGALGRAGQTMMGCFRPGLSTWLVGEVIIYEITDVQVQRLTDKRSGFELLQVGD
jgi:uncharacterized protein